MTDDDGTDPFGDPREGVRDITPADWDTPEWRAEMIEKYGNDGG